MKQILTALLCLLLCGCAPKTDAPAPEPAPQTQAQATVIGMYDPDHPLEKAYPGSIRAYPLTQGNVHGLRSFGSDVLALSGSGSTTLTLLTGEDLLEAATLTVDFDLRQEDPSLQIHEKGISFFDPVTRETLLLDRQLRQLRRIAAPPELSGKPILSADTGTLYYCTSWSVVAWDLESGIRRTLKELSFGQPELTALHRQEQFLQCRVEDAGACRYLLLSTADGRELDALPEDSQLFAGPDRYFAALPQGFHTLLITGDYGDAPRLLLPKQETQQQFYLAADHAAVTVSSGEGAVVLDCYELTDGLLHSSLTLDGLQTPKNIVSTGDGLIYILLSDPAAGTDLLLRWDISGQTPEDTAAYITPYRGAEDPDTEALEQCRAYAQRIAETYGITVRIWEDACQTQPWDYRFTPEYLAPVLNRELQLLEQRLALYPEGMLEKTAAHFSGLTLCLVREIQGSTGTGSLDSATGIQFFQDGHAYVVITTGKHSEQALYHELYHAMETHILTESIALDQWEALNPAGFSYGSESTDYDVYLQGQTRAFVDSYSMRYPKEDRARVLEYAMLDGNQQIFRSEYMQRKLTALCQGIRDAYGLKKQPEVLPWEQYLATPLVPES